MSDSSIEILIGLEGEINVKPNGFAGPSCEEATQAIERALGTSRHRQYTTDYYEQSETPTQRVQA